MNTDYYISLTNNNLNTMKDFNKEDYNKLCAEFLGTEETEYLVEEQMDLRGNKELLFHSDWDWIMQVIEKIENINEKEKHYQWEGIDGTTRNNFINYEVNIERNECGIWLNLELDPAQEYGYAKANTKKEAAVQAIWQFLNKYK